MAEQIVFASEGPVDRRDFELPPHLLHNRKKNQPSPGKCLHFSSICTC